MMMPARPYKNRLPDDTVLLIERDLQQLGIVLSERQTNHHSDFPSYRVSTQGLDAFNIGTNGKGMNKAYARASAYAEYMERLQNGVLFSGLFGATQKQFEALGREYPFFARQVRDAGIAPEHNACVDEVSVSREELSIALDRMQLGEAERKAMDEFYGKQERFFVMPFLSVFEEKIVHLPLSGIYALMGSNGMSAGNTPQEAILQGLCEIFERYAMRLLFESDMIMPDIPLEYFEKTEIGARIKKLQSEHGVDIIIKDAGCGIGLPVVGVVVIHKESHSYLCKFGSSPIPEVALERCLTEMFQGSDRFLFHPIDVETQAKLSVDPAGRHREMSATFRKAMGHYPLKALVGKSTYPFKGWPRPGANNEEDLRYFLQLLRKHGYSLYVRDVSYMKLNAYQCYIPGMSEAELDVGSLLRFMQLRGELFKRLHHLQSNTPEELRSLAETLYLNRNYIYTLTSMNSKDVLLSGNVQLLLAVLYYRAGMADEAVDALEKLIHSCRSPHEKSFYHCFRDMIAAEKEGVNPELLAPLHESRYHAMAQELMHRENWTQFFHLPPCYDCEHCSYKETCRMTEFYSVRHRVEQYFSSHIPNQHSLKSVFSPLPEQ